LTRPSQALLAWFDRHQRRLPWRSSRAPYPILVSELMLQQTRVDVVIPYFTRFLAQFPDIEALAEADPEALLAAWSGLGYYRRAHSLQRAAQAILARGNWPQDALTLQELPGIGPYTAAAVASQAFGQAVACVDGNVRRVAARLLALSETSGRAAEAALTAAATALLDAARPGDSNQALMELGATICPPGRPHCGSCPLAAVCAGRASGEPERFPTPRARRASVVVSGTAVVICRQDGGMLVCRRPAGDELLGGLWEPPWVAVRGGEVAAELSRRYGLEVALGGVLGGVRHQVTHHALRLEVVAATLEGARADEVSEGVASAWFGGRATGQWGATSLLEKVWRLADGGSQQALGLPASGED
jgi:A/G-specific adenine glycosylase